MWPPTGLTPANAPADRCGAGERAGGTHHGCGAGGGEPEPGGLDHADPGGGGSSDLIGLRQLLITPEHVGCHLAVFAAIEVKTAGGRLGEEQRKFLQQVQQLGGLAGVARSLTDAEQLLGGI